MNGLYPLSSVALAALPAGSLKHYGSVKNNEKLAVAGHFGH